MSKPDISILQNYEVRLQQADDSLGCCGDGRVGNVPENDPSGIAKFGNDFLYVTTLLALSKKHNLGITGENAVIAIYHGLDKIDRVFSYHTDDSGHSIGCKFIDRSIHEPKKFGIHSGEADPAFQHAEHLYNHRKVRRQRYKGPHAEVAFIENYGIERTFATFIHGQDNIAMTFLMDVTRTQKEIERLYPQLTSASSILAEHTTEKEFLHVADSQQKATKKLLDPHGNLPTFRVDPDSFFWQISMGLKRKFF